ncbi:hypothetical protein O4J56_10545 [Nocardiopsis sp. RSe5-2]|uniref:Uncharacterized protein n=1 Tax=Nocardiopsis endophytica TaxID=3018445 RepID=A0ABT4U2B0_9ACTN|nr:hypothetical protein [Nocardiopsis endophytica]MDA2811075.1 hypothetical protein [Nocardiopsis endophytica]
MHRIEIASFLKSSDGAFIPLDRWQGGVEDPDYVEGAIDLAVDGTVLLDTALWDYVDQLWAYILTMLSDLRSERRVRTYFPDQPIELVFQRTAPGRLLVTVKVDASDVRTADVAEAEFTAALAEAAEVFFSEMERILPGAYTVETRQLADLRN